MKTYLLTATLVAFLGVPAGAAFAQTAPAGAHTARSNPVDDVIKLVKSGMSEDLIIKSLKKRAKPVDIQTDDLVRLKEAGVSDAIISVMEDPNSDPAAKATPAAPAPAPAPATAATPTAAPTVTAAPAVTSASAPTMAETPNAQKKRVAIYPFDYSAVMNVTQAIFGTQQNVGEGIRSMLQMRLTQQGKLVVVERGKIDAILKEQDSAAGSRVKQGTGPRIGQISGADVILAGDIVVFGRDDKKQGAGVGAVVTGIGGYCSWCVKGAGAASGFKKEEKAVVVIDYRLIDSETAEILASGEKRGESKRSSKSFAGFAAGWNSGGGGAQVDMTSSNFGETIIGEATQDCINQIADEFTAKTQDMKKAVRGVEALVATVNGNSLVLNAGSAGGVNTGETFEILHVDQEVKDPVTKEVLDKIVSKVGECQVVSVREKISTCTYAGSPVAVGMVARKKL